MANEDLQCPICLYSISNDNTVGLLTACSHIFHSHCISTWININKKCPLCRSKVERHGGIDMCDLTTAVTFVSKSSEEKRIYVAAMKRESIAIHTIGMTKLEYFDHLNQLVFNETLVRPRKILMNKRVLGDQVKYHSDPQTQEPCSTYCIKSDRKNCRRDKRKLFDLMWKTFVDLGAPVSDMQDYSNRYHTYIADDIELIHNERVLN